MKTIANRIAVFAAGLLAFGTSGAFAQSRMTADIPFAFETVTGTLPAGTYEVTEVHMGGAQHLMLLRNKETGKTSSVGIPVWDEWKRAGDRGPRVEFSCKAGACSLSAIRTFDGSMEYSGPSLPKNLKEDVVALVAVPLKAASGD
jgi:hypothetical protein